MKFSTDRLATSWDKKKFIPNFLTSAFTQLIASFVSFLISYYILKKHNQQILGELVLFISVSQVFVFLTNWSTLSIQKLGAEEFLETNNIKTVFSARLLLLFLNFAIIALLYFLTYPLFKSKLPVSSSNSILAVLYAFILALNLHFYAGFQARKLLKVQGFLILTEKILIILALIFFSEYGSINITKVALIYFLSGLLITCFSIYYSWHSVSLRWQPEMIKKVAVFSLPLIPYAIVSFFTSNYTDSFFIKKYMQESDIALYSVAYQFNGVWMQIPVILGAVVLPLFITSNKNESEQTTLHYISTYGATLNFIWSILSFMLALMLIVVLPEVYSALNSGFFISLYIFIASSSLSFSPAVLFSPYLLSKGVLKLALPLAVISAVTNIAGNLLLIPLFGITGCALATVIFNFVFALLVTFYMNRKYRINLNKILINNIIVSAAIILGFSGYNLVALSVIFSGLFVIILLLQLEDVKKVWRIFSGYLKRNAVSNNA